MGRVVGERSPDIIHATFDTGRAIHVPQNRFIVDAVSASAMYSLELKNDLFGGARLLQ